MHNLTVGRRYCLRGPDGRALGHVRIERIDDLWASGTFLPTPDFEAYRMLFEREAELGKDQIIPLWEEAADAIASLQIQVSEEGQNSISLGYRIHIDGSEAMIGMPLHVPGSNSKVVM